jgi:hypothetical protein
MFFLCIFIVKQKIYGQIKKFIHASGGVKKF